MIAGAVQPGCAFLHAVKRRLDSSGAGREGGRKEFRISRNDHCGLNDHFHEQKNEKSPA